jgi:hypothetical protein
MTPLESLLKSVNDEALLLPLHEAHAAAVAREIPGWSGPLHHLFFTAAFKALPEIRSVLILGVYLGRDIALMSSACDKTRPLQIVGVDKFNAEPCDDWPEGKRGKTWQEAFGCEPPNYAQAQENIAKKVAAAHAVRLIECDDAKWLPSIVGSFDLIYIDTSHDEATVTRQIAQVKPLCGPKTIIAGDDYNDVEKTWGVQKAVNAGFKEHNVLGGIIWFTDASQYK